VGEEVSGLHEDPSVAGGAAAASTSVGGVADAALAADVDAEPIGAFLSRQRRLRGISLAELARITCIPLRSLERLESGAFDDEPDGFARGFVRTVASALGLDPDDAVARMLPEARPGRRRRTNPLPDPGPRVGLVLGLLAIGLVAVLLVEGRAGAPDATDAPAQRIVRRDSVRELARAEGLIPPRGASEIVPSPAGVRPAAPSAPPDAAPPPVGASAP